MQDSTPMFVMGVNHEKYTPAGDSERTSATDGFCRAVPTKMPGLAGCVECFLHYELLGAFSQGPEGCLHVLAIYDKYHSDSLPCIQVINDNFGIAEADM